MQESLFVLRNHALYALFISVNVSRLFDQPFSCDEEGNDRMELTSPGSQPFFNPPASSALLSLEYFQLRELLADVGDYNEEVKLSRSASELYSRRPWQGLCRASRGLRNVKFASSTSFSSRHGERGEEGTFELILFLSGWEKDSKRFTLGLSKNHKGLYDT